MRILPRISPAAVAVIAWYVLTGTANIARAEEAPLADMPPSGGAPARAQLTPVTLELTASQWDAVNLGRAVDLWLAGDLRGAAALLEDIDIYPGSAFDMADRAAFLLAALWLRLGDDDAFRNVAGRAAGPQADPAMSAWRGWIRYCDLVLSDGSGRATIDTEDMPGADILAAALMMETGRYDKALDLLESTDAGGPLEPLRLYLLALSREAIGIDPAKYWRQLSKLKPRSPLESDLVGAAVLRLAAGRIADGKSPGKVLERMPDDSRHAPRAKHVRALAALDRGDTADGRRMLEALLEEHPGYESSRDAGLALGGLRLDAGDWAAALAVLEVSETDWFGEYTALEQLDDDASLDTIWNSWEENSSSRDEIRLVSDAVANRVDGLAIESLDLRRTPSLDADAAMAAGMWPASRAGDGRPPFTRHQPLPEEWDAVRVARRLRLGAESDLARQDRLVADLRLDLERRLEYLRAGHDRSTGSIGEIDAAARNLDGILARIDSSVLQLEAVRDSARLDIAVRTREMIEGIRRDRLFVQALRHFHVEGPALHRPEEFPPGVPAPSSLLEMEEALGGDAESFLAYFAARSDSVIVRSFDEVWEPRLTGTSRLLRDALLAELDRARGIGAALDSALAWRADDYALLAATSRRDRMSATVDSLLSAERNVRRSVALAVAERARTRLEAEREAIDYSLADAAYELAVQAANDTETAEDTTFVAPPRRSAIARIEAFLSRYPRSPARGEGRYRLADLRLMEARDEFQRRMAGFLGEDPSADDIENRSLAPFVNYEPAIALYQSILAEDTEFPHIDAVLFNLGMILSDDGRPDASGYLERLVREFPDAPDCQEAWLRMGGDRFDHKDFAGSLALLEEAASGPEPQFAAIALYKLGWAHFEQDHFRDSADSFRRLMDLYLSDDELAADVDLRDEAEEYLVHSLARAGGALAFRDYFDAIGGRVYEDGILMSLGHLTRSVSLYDEAAACDELWIERYPLHPRSLEVSRRLVETYQEWNKPDAARQTKLELAERFLPGSQWHEANDDPALRAPADRFARGAYREAAAHHHKLARDADTRGAGDWRAALTHYDRYLSHWPDAGDSDLMHYLAGETAARLHRYPAALSHFDAAAGSDSSALAIDAAWQHVATSDAWYSSSVPRDSAAAGADSLATVLLASGDAFVAGFPTDGRCADIAWRQGNIAYAHGWFDDAAGRLESMGNKFPADSRAARAVRMAGDARYRLGDYGTPSPASSKKPFRSVISNTPKAWPQPAGTTGSATRHTCSPASPNAGPASNTPTSRSTAPGSVSPPAENTPTRRRRGRGSSPTTRPASTPATAPSRSPSYTKHRAMPAVPPPRGSVFPVSILTTPTRPRPSSRRPT